MTLFLLLIASLAVFSCQKNDENGTILVINKDTSVLVKLTESDYRPIYHFTPPFHWMNDPNGLVFYQGKYHLFYQFNPDASVWGPMNWGHCTSTDLFNWQDMSIALTPDNLGTIFSGSAVIDVNNSAGFKTGIEDPMVAIFTHAGTQQSQSIAYSNDGGMSWNKYAFNPVLPNPGVPDFRDPKVFWYSPQQKWIMVLAVGDKVSIYSSSDLKNWVFESNFGINVGAHSGVWECPDLFELPVEGTNSTKWVMLVSCNGGPNGGTATQYFVGDFDGKNYTIQTQPITWIDYGTDNYAGVTYNNIPAADGRRIFIGWMSNWSYAQQVPTIFWRSTMTMPRFITLVNSGQGYKLNFNPVDEYKIYEADMQDTIVQLAAKSIHIADNEIIKTGSYELNFSADLSKSSTITLTLGNSAERLIITLDKNAGNVVIDRSQSGQVDFNNQFSQKIYCPFVPKIDQLTDFQIFVDKTSVELFLNHGEKVMTALFFPKYQYNDLKLKNNTDLLVLSNFKLKGIKKSIQR